MGSVQSGNILPKARAYEISTQTLIRVLSVRTPILGFSDLHSLSPFLILCIHINKKSKTVTQAQAVFHTGHLIPC